MTVTSIVIIVCMALAAVLFLATLIFLIHTLRSPQRPEPAVESRAVRTRPALEGSSSGVPVRPVARPAAQPQPQPAPMPYPAQPQPVAMFIRLGGPGEAPVTTTYGPAPVTDPQSGYTVYYAGQPVAPAAPAGETEKK